MFTGLVETVGRVVRTVPEKGNLRLVIQAGFAPELKRGESVAVQGCCLTVVGVQGDRFEVSVVAETLKRTTLEALVPGRMVNLERAVRLGERLGGHFVLGHIDEVGRVQRFERSARGARLVIAVDPARGRWLVERGSVAVDGVSLTVAGVKRGSFSVNLIPFTLDNTTLGGLRFGARVNIEYDILLKGARPGERPHPAVPLGAL